MTADKGGKWRILSVRRTHKRLKSYSLIDRRRRRKSIKFLFKSLQIPFPCKSLLNLIERSRDREKETCNTVEEAKDAIPYLLSLSFPLILHFILRSDSFQVFLSKRTVESSLSLLLLHLLQASLHNKSSMFESLAEKEMEFPKIFLKTKRGNRILTKKMNKKTGINAWVVGKGRQYHPRLRSWGKQENESSISSKDFIAKSLSWIELMIEK